MAAAVGKADLAGADRCCLHYGGAGGCEHARAQAGGEEHPALRPDAVGAGLHAVVDWAFAALRSHPHDILRGVLDVAGLSVPRSAEPTSGLQSIMRHSYAGFLFEKKKNN